MRRTGPTAPLPTCPAAPFLLAPCLSRASEMAPSASHTQRERGSGGHACVARSRAARRQKACAPCAFQGTSCSTIQATMLADASQHNSATQTQSLSGREV